MCQQDNGDDKKGNEEVEAKICNPWVSVTAHGGSIPAGFVFSVDWGGGCGSMITTVDVVAIKKVGGGSTNICNGMWPGLPESPCSFKIPEPTSLYYMIECHATTECQNTCKTAHASNQIQFDEPEGGDESN